VRRFSWLLVAAAMLIAACSDDNGSPSSGPLTRGGAPGSSATLPPATTGAPPSPNEACEIVSREDAEQLFGEPARPGVPEGAGDDAVCVWEAGDDGGATHQFLEFRVHEGGDLRSVTINTGGGVVLTSQWTNDGRSCGLRYIGTGVVGESAEKQTALDELKARIGPCTG
jgi:hypothetical protein